MADVFEMDLPRVQPGAKVRVKVVAYPDREFSARVDWISPALDPQTRSARVRATLRNPGRELLPEMYATLLISTAPRTALAVPRSALLHLGDQTVVLVQTGRTENGLLRFQPRGEQVEVSGALLLSGML